MKSPTPNPPVITPEDLDGLLAGLLPKLANSGPGALAGLLANGVSNEKGVWLCDATVAERDNEAGVHKATIVGTKGPNRNRLEIDFMGGEFENYKNNPVVLWDHGFDTDVPIAKTLDIVNGPKAGVRTTFQFNEEDEFAMRIQSAWDNGFLGATSIGFRPLEYEIRRDSEGDFSHIYVQSWDLVEWSIVSTPADPLALKQAAQMAGLPEFLFRTSVPAQDGVDLSSLTGQLGELTSSLGALMAFVLHQSQQPAIQFHAVGGFPGLKEQAADMPGVLLIGDKKYTLTLVDETSTEQPEPATQSAEETEEPEDATDEVLSRALAEIQSWKTSFGGE